MPRLQIDRRYWVSLAAGCALLGAVAWLPYLVAGRVGPESVFTGLLLNPVDGHSYLAKMRQGWAGSWLFTLPYTAEPGPGVFFYVYYLSLGHLTRWLGWDLVGMYHAARLLGWLALLLTAGVFLARCLKGGRARATAWLLFAVGSGAGWVATPLGGFTADLWVAEAFPFLAGLTNAHFALGFALLLWVVLLALPEMVAGEAETERREGEGARLAGLALVTTMLAQVQPLALVNAGLILVGVAVWQMAARRSWQTLRLERLFIFGVFATPWVLYDLWLLGTHPVLREWNAQNLTLSPPAWDMAVSGGVPLLLAVAGLVRGLKRRGPQDMLLAVWLMGGVAAMYAPFALQRRLSMGLWMPVCVLAAQALRDVIWPRLRPAARPAVAALIGLMVVPSNLLVYAAALGAVAERNPVVFLSAAEAGALRWLGESAPTGGLVAASPEMGLYVPAWSDSRVLYGHPFETVRAEERRALVEAFYAGTTLSASFVNEYHVDLVMLGPRERALGAQTVPADWRVVYDVGGVSLYAP
jgi:hypothetical protein